jgi:branched-chain amino acid transport system ATP-binding protein
MILTVEDLNVSYGLLPVLSGLSFRIGKGEIVSLVGANGAGKTTTLRAVSGIVRLRSGRIVFAGTDIAGLPSHRIARLGIAHVPEGRGIFGNMTVMENLDLGAGSRRSRHRLGENLERVFTIFPRLKERARQVAGTLSGGEQQMLAIGRALVASPDLMLLDEPSMGLSPLLVTEIFRLIAEINRAGTSILLVEQNAYMALSVAHRAYVLETGRIAVEGKASDLRKDPKVKAAYLGDVAG